MKMSGGKDLDSELCVVKMIQIVKTCVVMIQIMKMCSGNDIDGEMCGGND